MSRYEALHEELGPLLTRQLVAIMAPTALIAITLIAMADSLRFGLTGALATLVTLPLLLHPLWRLLIPAYRSRSERRATIRRELQELDRHISAIFAGYRERQQGEHFKKAYELAGRPVRDLEEALSVGMFRERREVFVTAFMRQGIAVRVTASIGSPMRCSAADNPSRWKEHVERLGCDEIRQYHNHPVHDGHTSPSRTDVRTSKTLRKLLGPHGSEAALADHLLEPRTGMEGLRARHAGKALAALRVRCCRIDAAGPSAHFRGARSPDHLQEIFTVGRQLALTDPRQRGQCLRVHRPLTHHFRQRGVMKNHIGRYVLRFGERHAQFAQRFPEFPVCGRGKTSRRSTAGLSGAASSPASSPPALRDAATAAPRRAARPGRHRSDAAHRAHLHPR